MKKISLLAAILFLVSSAGFVAAGPGDRGKGMKCAWEMEDSILTKLDLSAGQIEEIRVLRESFQREITPLRSQVFEKKAELRMLWNRITLDPAKIMTLDKDIHGLMGRLREKSTDYRLAFRRILTPEQSSRFVAMGGARHPHHRKGKDVRTGKK
jgi:Spy/CpxP family protein refolding chaperone